MRACVTGLFLTMGLVFTTAPLQAQNVTITQDGRYYIEKTEQTFSVKPGGTLTIDSPASSIRIDSGSGNVVEVLVEKRVSEKDEADAIREFDDVDVALNQAGNDVRILVDGFRNRSYRSLAVRFTVKVPEQYNLNLKTGGGSIRVGDLQGDVRAETSGGSIEVGRITAGQVDVATSGGNISIREGEKNVMASTSGGNITVRRVGGDLEASTSGGSIEIGPVGGRIRVNTAGGSIRLEESGASVRAKTAGGSIRVDGSNGPGDVETAGGSIEIEKARGAIDARTAGGDVEAELIVSKAGVDTHCYLKTAGGDVTIYLPENLAATIDAEIRLQDSRGWREDDYRIFSDFNLNIEGEDDRRRGRITAQGDINGGGDLIRLNTTNGDIHIRKLKK